MRNDGNDDVLISAWEVALNNEIKPWAGEVAYSVKDEPNVEHENHSMECRRTKDEDVIAREVRYAVKDLVHKNFSTMIKQLLHDILRKSLQKA